MVLDSGSSVDLFCNKDWIQDIEKIQNPQTLHTNAGGLKVTLQGMLPKYGQAPLDKTAMTNILSLGVLSSKYRITMDTAKDNASSVRALHPYPPLEKFWSFWVFQPDNSELLLL